MPKIIHSNLGNMLSMRYCQGIITSLDRINDTCQVLVNLIKTNTYFNNVPLYYHCYSNALVRNNGALQGAAAAFVVGDRVIVRLKADKSNIKVIGFDKQAKRGCITCPSLAEENSNAEIGVLIGNYENVNLISNLSFFSCTLSQEYDWSWYSQIAYLDFTGLQVCDLIETECVLEGFNEIWWDFTWSPDNENDIPSWSAGLAGILYLGGIPTGTLFEYSMLSNGYVLTNTLTSLSDSTVMVNCSIAGKDKIWHYLHGHGGGLYLCCWLSPTELSQTLTFWTNTYLYLILKTLRCYSLVNASQFLGYYSEGFRVG